MRILLAVFASAALALPALAWATSGAADDGTLAVKNGDGVVFVVARGTVIGAGDQCRVSHDIYSGTDVRFRLVGGIFRIKISGSGIDLGVVAKGWGRIQAYDSNTGTFSVNGAPNRLLPADREIFVLTST
jgi:hypothetical protein